jgi:D-alanyl-D-alanine carboxypeptidase
MSHTFKKTVVLVAAALTLCSCSSPNIEIVEYGLPGAERSEILSTVYTEPLDELNEVTEEQFFPVSDAVALPETTTVAEAVPFSSELAADISEDTTAVSSANSYMLALSSNAKKYSYEYQSSSGSLTILGPNLVYVGESFDFDCAYPDADKSTEIIWTVLGSSAKVDNDGNFTAISRSVCTLIATDKKTGVYSAMRVHCIEPGDDVDFIPLVNNIPIANKSYPLPKDYDPGLDPTARASFLRMQADAKAQGLSIFPISAYRSYSYQQQVYDGWVKMYGSEADLVSARPGHSEHQLGLAIDVNSLEYSFENTREGKWLREHCAEYGFIIRYPSNEARQYTGYSYEPWHIRYVGKTLAKTVMSSGKTLEEILGIDSYYR